MTIERRMDISFVIAGFTSLLAASIAFPAAHQPSGCYRFNRPLGQSASGQLEARDSSWYRVQFLPQGAVARPTLSNAYWRQQYAERSSWREHGDTLFVRVTTGLVGWDLALLPTRDGYAGTARYLTDALGGQPYVAQVQAERESCAAPPPTQTNPPSTTPVGTWRGESLCLVRPSACNDEVVVYRITPMKSADSVAFDARKIVRGEEQEMGVLACRLVPPSGQLTCTMAQGIWHFTVRGDSLTGELRLLDSTRYREVRTIRAPWESRAVRKVAQ